MKRIFDFCFAIVLLVLFLLPMLVISLLIVLESGFPVLFVQERIGKAGITFRMYKFRTMTVLKEAEKGRFDVGNASRVTVIGRFLRRSKLDELPQLLNVLKGDMSVVGPRPEVRQWVNAYPERWERVLKVKPGITDNASVYFRNEEQLLEQSDDPHKTYRDVILPKKLSFYEDYVSGHSFFKDFKIIFLTIKAVLFN
ncbi:sugar transferase [Marinilabilia salmonicolor]|uniref:Lipopolysaccharide/colanic/teichoic acid biosynthesis glycosyltransferase n=1 Tax=Marinilabilia salmonicolor TaxID=989 RepID=A0A368V2Q5_9BACT|nr:sugar transferase [Marinilabilia salmonicolor]RCW35382.1 lipopolysaccharide/colanic/teichoic acid biosynthesis glycosyltransferase [Marinilabilia salmonicolor]